MRTLALIACLALVPLAARATDEPLSPYRWQQQQKVAFEQSERVYKEALARKGLLARYRAMRDAYRSNDDKAFRIVFGQYLSWYQSFVGDYTGAHDSYSIRQLAAPGDAPQPLAAGYTARPALDAIATLAHGRRAIFLNEAHNVPQTRSLTVQLLARLRADGYTHFAAETLYASDHDLARRGYPVEASGFYTMEPVCAEMVRTALALGFKVVAYESEQEGNGDVREYAQAKNLYQRVFKHDPDARVVVNAGYAHIQENGRYLGGRSMAQHFRRISDIDPLTIEQTMLIQHPPGTEDHPWYHAVVDAVRPTQPVVMMKDGKPWSLKPGAYDASVFFPPVEVRAGRPTWAALGGLRRRYAVEGIFCQDRFPCLVEARPLDEGDDAIPSDRMVLDPVKDAVRPQERLFQRGAQVSGDLYLRPGRYRVIAVDDENRTISRRTIRVDAAAAAP
jgi:hypothetical protein